MSGFVRGGPRGSGGDSGAGQGRTRIVSPQREIVEVAESDPLIVHVIEPVLVGDTSGPGAVTLDDLDDVDAPVGTVGLLERQSDGVVHPVTRDVVLAPHIAAVLPHPAYDDALDLTLIFNNGLV